MGFRTVFADRPSSAWLGGLGIANKAGRGGSQNTGHKIPPRPFMDTRSGNDFQALSPPMTVGDWTANSGNPPMVARVKHITSNVPYWFLFNHGSTGASPVSIMNDFDSNLLGDPNRLLGVRFVITCYPPAVQRAMAGVGPFLQERPKFRQVLKNRWIRGEVFTHLARCVEGTDYHGTTTIGHSNKYSLNDFWIDFTNDP